MKAGIGLGFISANRSESVHVQPELKLPTKGEKGLDWTSSDAAHPYWFIKRTEKDESQANAHLVFQDVTHVMACSFQPLSSAVAALAPATDTFTVTLPCIVNMQPIVAGGEVILKWKPPPEKRTNPATETNAFGHIAHDDNKIQGIRRHVWGSDPWWLSDPRRWTEFILAMEG